MVKQHGFGFAITEDYEKAFIVHTKRVLHGMAGFCMNALTSFKLEAGRELTESEIQQIIDFELLAVLQQVQGPKSLEYVKEYAKSTWLDCQGSMIEDDGLIFT